MGWRVLVVDDEKHYCELLRRVLEKEDFRVVTEQEPEKAMAHLLAGRVDLLITDLHMPGLSGYDLVELARSLPRPPHILAITAQMSTLDGFVRRLQGAQCLLKPFELADFRAKLALLTGRWDDIGRAGAEPGRPEQ